MVDVSINNFSYTEALEAYRYAERRLNRPPTEMRVSRGWEMYMEQAMRDAAIAFRLPVPKVFPRPFRFMSATIVIDNVPDTLLRFA